MGRVFVSPRMGVRATAERWCRAGRGLRDADRAALERLAGMAMAYSSQGFFAFDDPLEAAIVAVLAGLVREEERSAAGASPGGNGIVGGG
ncbi:MAG TPA: hypothetical protein PLY91_04925 [Methanoregulaceae archaeon]|nr:hypothetical protein [Methanoregulaceae archaeon]